MAGHDYGLWSYNPSFEAAIVFAVVFGCAAAAHIAQAIIYKKRFCGVIVMAAVWEAVGYGFRIPSTWHQASEAYYIPMQIFIVLAPLWINAFDYMIVGRMINLFIPEKRVLKIPARRLTLVFVLLDITSFVVQALGGVLMTGNNAKMAVVGLRLLTGGLAFQLLCLLLFINIAVRFHIRATEIDSHSAKHWRRLLYIVYITLALIVIRGIFRLIEWSQRTDAPVTKSEGYFYGLDSVLMSAAIILYNIWHPGKFLVGEDSEFEKRERKWGRKKTTNGNGTVDLDALRERARVSHAA